MYEQPTIFPNAEDVPAGVQKSDILASALKELFFVEHPQLRKDSLGVAEQVESFCTTNAEKGMWVHYPWLNSAIRIPSENIYFKLRTARNRNLITDEEQRSYRNARVGIAGLSVGLSAFSTLVLTGGPKRIKIADPDTIDVTNLNRIRGTLMDVNANKTYVAARDAWELDPFLELELYPNGLTEAVFGDFLTNPRLDVYVDEMDNIELKILGRMLAKEAQIPVVMATDNGDSVIMDIERFDLEPERPIFHGRVEISREEARNINREKFVELANKIIDPTFFMPRQWESIQQIGKTISGVPQLGSAASIAGAAVAYAVRQIVTKADFPSGRYAMGCEAAFAGKKA